MSTLAPTPPQRWPERAERARRGAGLATRMPLRDVGILPLMAALPFMYYPRALEGDTQLWVLIGAVIALFTFRPKRFMLKGDSLMILLAVASAAAYAVRGGTGAELLRACYTQVAFIIFWLVCKRENSEYFPTAIRLTIVIWLAVGLYQYTFVALGLPIEIEGRFMQGRGGIPSLTSEPSTYGSLSMLQMMYLLSQKNPKNNPYIAAAAASVVLSGSLLSLLLFVFPLMKLKAPFRIAILLAAPLLVAADYLFTSAGLTSRLSALGAEDAGLIGLLLDPSLNLRFGHIYFTLFVNFFDSLFSLGPIAFMEQYNAFAQNSGLFIETGSNFILPAIGELIYGSGIVGMALLYVFLHKSLSTVPAGSQRIEKAAFLLACMINPISMSNTFLIIYAQQRAGDKR